MKKHIHPCSGKAHWFSHIGPSAAFAFALAVALSLGNIAAFAQIPISIPNAGFTYTQDFNTLAASGTENTIVPAGWAFFETSAVFGTNTIYRAGDASGVYFEQTYDTYSLGATGNSDRAFGSITSTGQDTLNTTIGACFTNNTGATITSFTITYTGETWRVSSPNRVDGLVFQYNQNTTAINGPGTWTAFSALNYFNPGDPTEGGGSMRHSTGVSATISGLNIAPGNTFCFRWLNFDATPVMTPNNEDAIGIDDFSLSNIVACSSASILYVNDDATGANDGSSWTNAFNDLQSALALANQCPNITQIWVAAGTYKPTSGTDRSISFNMKNGVEILGGFPNTGDPGLDERNWAANVTILSGEIGAAGMADNTLNIIKNTGLNLNPTAVIDGFQIAFANGTNARGGGIENGNNSSPTIRNCSFLSNSANFGGAINNNNGCSPTITNCVFLGNQSTVWGGAIFSENTSVVTLINCSFSGNTGNPGVIYSNGQPAVLKNCIIWGNGTQAIAGLATINNSIIEGGYTGAGNLNFDPLFVSQPPVGLGTAGDLRLQICSPAIDAGNDSDNTTLLDLGSNPRKFESIPGVQMIDMGAYEYQSSSRPGDPAVFGNNVWNAYVWRSGGSSLPNSSAWNNLYSGYYVENNLSINTETRWPANGAPSQASGYQGCAVDNENHSYSYKRKGFPAAYYQLNIDGHDDAAQLWINGTNVWEHSGCCDAHVNVWAGNLGANDEVEFRVTEGAGGSLGKLSIIKCPTGNVLYVNDDATGANDGSSWTDAFTDLQSALNSTCFGVTEIWVAAGTYKPTSGTDRNISFVMKNGVGIYGGFNGTETMRAQRNWTLNATTLSGDLVTAGNNSDNSYHVIFNNNNDLSNTAVLDGFTITGGNANGGSTASYGGGMYNINASPTIANCNFTQNSASFSGGAVYQGGTYNSSFTGCQFDANSAPFGGALSSSGFAPSAGTTRLTNCHFTNNTATNGGGAINNGFSNTTGTSLCVFTNCTFLNNICHNGSTIGTGGAYQSQFVGFNADFINCAFNGNKALGTADDGGGALMIYAGAVTLLNSTIANSQSATNGGAVSVFNSNGSVVIKNSILWNNAASTGNSVYSGTGGSANAEYSLLQESACPPNTTCGAGMIYNKNPLFVSAADLRLQACSPAVNTGSNAAVPGGITTDLDNNTRIFGGTVDMGAYEFQATPTPIVPVCQNQTVYLNNMGMATFSPALLSNGTTGCGTLLYTIGGQSTLNFTCADIGAPIPVTLTVTDDRGITATCSATITVVDNTPPTVQCFDQTLYFNGEESIALDADDLADASDNCGVQSISLSSSSISAERVGQIVPVTVTATDISGNTATCTSNITVSGFPAGWSQQPGGAGCSGNNNTYNSGNGVWTATSTNCYYASPFTSDATSFVQRTLCGDGSITAQVTSINGSALGWAGIVMRESNAPGAKKTQLMTNLSNFSRREFRTATNGEAYPQQFPSQNRYWLRLVRAGNQFSMYVSPNGMAWYFAGAQNIAMNNCIQMGLVVTNYTANSTVTATFAGVSFTGSNATAASYEPRAASLESPYSFEVYPNPTSGELNLDLTQYIGRSVRIETYSLEGKLLQFSEIDEVQATVEQLNLRAFPGGMYLVKVKSAGLPDATRRIVVNRN